MKLKVYPEERFERWWIRYTIFGIICSAILIVSFLRDNIYGAIILLPIIWAYLYFHTTWKNPIYLKIQANWLAIEDKTIAWINIQSYVIEMDKKLLIIKNIVLVFPSKHEIYTLADSIENLQKFSEELENYIPRVGEYQQSWLEKFYRKIKL